MPQETMRPVFPAPIEASRTILPEARLVLLDIPRAVAAFIVFLGHWRGLLFVEFGALPVEQRTLAAAAFFAVTRIGHEAVLIFFVLSGYLVGGAVLRRLEQNSFSLRAYAIDRVTRIAIPLVPAVLFSVAVSWVIKGVATTPAGILGNMIGLNGILVQTIDANAPLWSLAYEIWFYVLAGALACLMTGSGSVVFVLGALNLTIVVFAVLDARYCLIWGLGAVMVYLEGCRCRAVLAIAGLVLLAVGIASYQVGIASRSVSFTAMLPQAVAEALVGGGFALCIPVLIAGSAGFSGRTHAALAAALADMSFSLYLFHYPLLAIAAGLQPRQRTLDPMAIGQCVGVGVLTFLACLLFYGLFERNTGVARRLLRKRFSDR